MLNKPTEKQINIITALASNAAEWLEESLDCQLQEMRDYLQFLADADLINPEDYDSYVRSALHSAIELILDAQSEEKEETKQDSCCNK